MGVTYNPNQNYAIYKYDGSSRRWHLFKTTPDYLVATAEMGVLTKVNKVRLIGFPTGTKNYLPNPATAKELNQLKRHQTWICKGESKSGTELVNEIKAKLAQGKKVRIYGLF